MQAAKWASTSSVICQFNILTIAESSAQLLYFIFPFHLFKFFLVCCVCTISLIFLRLLCCSSYFRSVECSRARHNYPVFCENGKILVFLDHFARAAGRLWDSIFGRSWAFFFLTNASEFVCCSIGFQKMLVRWVSVRSYQSEDRSCAMQAIAINLH